MPSWERLTIACFRGSVALLGCFFIGFPVTAAVRGLLFPRPVRRSEVRALVSLIITAHNEERLIAEKLDNALQLEYPRELLEIIVASDGSSDRTNELAATFAQRGVRLLELPRRGKNATMTAAAAVATGEILVFNDADTAVTPNAIAALLAPFGDPQVGAVASERRHRSEGKGPASVQRRLGRKFQRLLSDGGSVTTAGLLYAIRREHFRPVPPNVVDDLFIPVQAVIDHRRLVFEPRAATYPLGPALRVRDPFARSVRMNVQLLRTYPTLARLLNPLEYGFYSVQLVCQKVLRRFLLIPLAGLLVSGLLLWPRRRVYRVVTTLQLGLHATAMIGLLLHSIGHSTPPILRRVMQFDRDLLAGGVALGAVLTVSNADRWESHSRQEISDAIDRTSRSGPLRTTAVTDQPNTGGS